MARAISCGAGVPPVFLQSVEFGKIAGGTPAPREPASLRKLDELNFADGICREKCELILPAETHVEPSRLALEDITETERVKFVMKGGVVFRNDLTK